jgi:hypothetical protein
VDSYLDICEMSVNKSGEQLCGDQMRTLRTRDKTIVVLSDGLGSGVKANILSTLTTSILITLSRSDVGLQEAVNTVIGTLPICRVRKVAYATFTILEVDHRDSTFRLANFDNPSSLFFRGGRLREPDIVKEEILGHEIKIATGTLRMGDFIGLMTDGVPYAGLGELMNFGWGRDNIVKFVEGTMLRNTRTAKSVVSAVMNETKSLYRGHIGDDATFVGIYVRKRNAVMVFTGPPLDRADDAKQARRLLAFEGRKVVCGGTTANLVAGCLGLQVETDINSMRADVPPIGDLPGLDLVTEGIFTMTKALEILKQCGGDLHGVVADYNGAYMLAHELLWADTIDFVVGQSINEWYQNPLLPRSISIRRQIVEEMVAVLKSCNKEVTLLLC